MLIRLAIRERAEPLSPTIPLPQYDLVGLGEPLRGSLAGVPMHVHAVRCPPDHVAKGPGRTRLGLLPQNGARGRAQK